VGFAEVMRLDRPPRVRFEAASCSDVMISTWMSRQVLHPQVFGSRRPLQRRITAVCGSGAARCGREPLPSIGVGSFVKQDQQRRRR